MILSNYDSFIFTHIPKCGGTSFREYIYQTGITNGISPEKMHIPGFGGLPNNKNIEQLTEEELEVFRSQRKRILACHARYNVHAAYYLNMYNPFYFVIFREPVRRFISHYNFFYRDLGYGDLKGVSLNEISAENLTSLLSNMSNLQLVYVLNLEKPIGRKADESWLEEAKKNLTIQYDAFGILENMEESIEWLKAKAPSWLSFPDMDFPIKNKGNGLQSSSVEQHVIEMIQRHNYFDLKLYEFAVELLAERAAGMPARQMI